MPNSPVSNYEGIICDGSIRSGKTVSQGISFFIWAFTNFNEQNFVARQSTLSDVTSGTGLK